jgi:hypothetical protein
MSDNSDLVAQIDELFADCRALEKSVQRKLVAGEDTSADRTLMESIKRRREALILHRRGSESEIERRYLKDVIFDAGIIAKHAIKRLDDRINALQPPPKPQRRPA